MNVETMQALRQRRRVQRSAWQPVRNPFNQPTIGNTRTICSAKGIAPAVQSNSQTTVLRCAGSTTRPRIT